MYKASKNELPRRENSTRKSVKSVAARYEVSVATIWRWCKEGHIPSPIKIGPNCSRWRLEDLEAWEAEKEAV